MPNTQAARDIFLEAVKQAGERKASPSLYLGTLIFPLKPEDIQEIGPDAFVFRLNDIDVTVQVMTRSADTNK